MRLPVALIGVMLAASAAFAQSSTPQPVLRRTIPLPGVKGRVGHMACDPASQRLFVAASDQGSIEVVDLAAGQRIASISGLKRPRGMALVPGTGLVAVTCAGDGVVRAYDCRTLEEKSARTAGDDVNHIQFNDRTGQLLAGYGSGALMVLQPRSLNQVGQIALQGRPGAFEIDPGGSRVFINTPGGFLSGNGRVVVADLNSRQVLNTWELKGIGGDCPTVYDAGRQRLYLVNHRPARLVSVDVNTGQVVGSVECVADAEDVFLDAPNQRLYIVGGAGQMDIFECSERGCTKVAAVQTAAGARTGLLVPERRLVYVAVPSRGSTPAEAREYLLME